MELRSNPILSTWNWSAIRLGRLYPGPSRGTFRGAESEWVMTRLTHSRLSINSSFTPRLFLRRWNFPLPGADLSFDHSILGIPSASDGCKCPAELRRLVQCLPNSFKNVNVKAALKSISTKVRATDSFHSESNPQQLIRSEGLRLWQCSVSFSLPSVTQP